MYVESTPSCPECYHLRCKSCEVEHDKKRVGVKLKSRFRPGIKRFRDDNLPIFDWFPKVDFAALKQKGIHPSDDIEILKAEIRKGTVLDPRKSFTVCSVHGFIRHRLLRTGARSVLRFFCPRTSLQRSASSFSKSYSTRTPCTF